MSDTLRPVITDNGEKSRFEAELDGVRAGYAHYRLGAGTITFDHTVVDPAFGGRGVGSALVRHALDAVRADGERKVIATCSFVKDWIAKHPEYAEYADLLA